MPVEIIGGPVTLPNGAKLPFCAATKAGGLIFLSGSLGVDETFKIVDGGIEAQTTQCLRNLEQAISAAGATLTDVAKVQVWLADLADFAGFNKAYAAMFGDHLPARSTVQSPLLLPGALVEIEMVAVDPAN